MAVVVVVVVVPALALALAVVAGQMDSHHAVRSGKIIIKVAVSGHCQAS